MTSGPEGTTLSLRLPVWHAAPPARETAASTAQPAAAEPLPALSVLLVDDDEYNIVVLKNLLPSPPLTVRTAVNGRAALELARAEPADVIFMDLEMPVMGGLEAADRIRAMQAEREEKPSVIAAFSAHDDDLTRQKCLSAGFDMYLAKPASREEVFAVLRGQDPAAAAASASSGPEDSLPGLSSRVWVEPGLMALMPDFLLSRRKLADELARAVEQGERETVRATAHKLAGSLAMYGFKEASRASRALEQAAGTEDFTRLRGRCDALAKMIARAQPMPRPAAPA